MRLYHSWMERAALPVMLPSASSLFDHLVSPHLSREDEDAYAARRRDHQPRRPQRRLKQHDVDQSVVVDRITHFTLNRPGLSFEKAEQPTPNAVRRRPQTD